MTKKVDWCFYPKASKHWKSNFSKKNKNNTLESNFAIKSVFTSGVANAKFPTAI